MTAKVGGYGDTWLQNNLNTNEVKGTPGVRADSVMTLPLACALTARPELAS